MEATQLRQLKIKNKKHMHFNAILDERVTSTLISLLLKLF